MLKALHIKENVSFSQNHSEIMINKGVIMSIIDRLLNSELESKVI